MRGWGGEVDGGGEGNPFNLQNIGEEAVIRI